MQVKPAAYAYEHVNGVHHYATYVKEPPREGYVRQPLLTVAQVIALLPDPKSHPADALLRSGSIDGWNDFRAAAIQALRDFAQRQRE